MRRIYDQLGRLARKPIGFGKDYEFDIEGDEDTVVYVDLIGSSISYWSETEERWITDHNSKIKQK